MLFVVLMWQVTFQRRISPLQGFALMLLFVAAVTKVLDSISGEDNNKEPRGTTIIGLVYIVIQVVCGALASIASEALLKELRVPTDLQNVCLYGYSILTLLVGVRVVYGPTGIYDQLLSAESRARLSQDKWMIASIVTFSFMGITVSYPVRELSNILKEVAGSLTLIVTCALQW